MGELVCSLARKRIKYTGTNYRIGSGIAIGSTYRLREVTDILLSSYSSYFMVMRVVKEAFCELSIYCASRQPSASHSETSLASSTRRRESQEQECICMQVSREA